MTIALARLFRLLLKVREPAAVHGVRKDPTAPETIAFHLLSETVDEIIQRRKEGRIQLNTPNVLRNRKPLLRPIMEIILLITTYAGFLACGVVTAYLATDSKALSTNSKCGLYVPSSNLSQSQDVLGPFAFQAQLDSAKLAESCYDTESGANDCNFFVQQSIPYTPSDDPCPFVDGMCHENMSSASQFSTGPIDAATVGINAPRTWQFQRNTTCVPLNRNETYITTSEKDGIYTHTYNYGSSNGLPFTWQTKTQGSNLEWQAHYLVRCVSLQPSGHETRVDNIHLIALFSQDLRTNP